MFTTSWPKPWPIVRDDSWPEMTHRLNTLIGMATRLLHVLIPLSLNPSRTGGYLIYAHSWAHEARAPRPRVHLLVPIGVMPIERATTYAAVALEKVRRLHRHPEHLSSYQSRQPGSGRYGGAVRARRSLTGFSGLEEHDDEALVLVSQIWIGDLSVDQATDVAQISANPSFPQLLRAFEALPPE